MLGVWPSSGMWPPACIQSCGNQTVTMVCLRTMRRIGILRSCPRRFPNGTGTKMITPARSARGMRLGLRGLRPAAARGTAVGLGAAGDPTGHPARRNPGAPERCLR